MKRLISGRLHGSVTINHYLIHISGAPNENIVQNHLKIALLNVFQYLNSRYRHIFIAEKFFICSDFLDESLVMRKLQGSKLTFSNISARKMFPKILGDLGQLYHFWRVQKSQERQASKKFNNKCSENSRSQIVFRTDIFQKLSLDAPIFRKGNAHIIT